MGTTTKGRLVGSDPEFKQRKPKSISASLKLGSQRKYSLEKKAIQDKQADEKAKAKEISRREKERKAMRTDLTKRVSSEETDPNRNTDARRRVVNVGRPDTAKSPMDTRSKLAKQGEIKTKIIEDQEKSMTMQKYHNLPDDLVAAVRSVLEGKNPFASKDDDKKSAKKDDDKDDSDDKDMKSKKSDDDDDDKDAKSSKKSDGDDDDADKPVGKDGKKTKVDIAPNMKTANEELKGGQKKLDKNHNGKLDKQDFKMLHKEEVEQVDELSNKTLRGYSVGASRHLMDIKPAHLRPSDYQHGAAVGAHGKTAQKRAQGLEKAGEKIKQNIAKTNAATKEEVEQVDEKHIGFAKLEKKIAAKGGVKDPGAVAAAIGRKKYGKKKFQAAAAGKKLKEEVALSDEETARILAKLNEADDDDDKHDGPEHIVMQLRKAKSLGAANRPIHFHDGSKVNVSSAHVQKALDMHGSFKKAPDKDEFTKKLQASHASFKSALGEK